MLTARIDDIAKGIYVYESTHMTGSPFYKKTSFIFSENPFQKNN